MWLPNHKKNGLNWPKNVQTKIPEKTVCYGMILRTFLLGSRWGLQFAKGLPNHKSGLNRPKNVQNYKNTWLYALAGDSAAFTLVLNHFLFIRWPKVRFLGLKREFIDHKVAPRPQKRPDLVKECPRSSKILHFLLALAGKLTDVTLVINHLVFIKYSWVRILGLKRGFTDHKVAA